MRKVFVSLLLVFGFAAAGLGQAATEPADFDAARARVYRAAPGQSLVKPAPAAAPADLVGRFMAGRGASAAVLASLRTSASDRDPRSGATHIRMEQYVAGLRVEGAYLRATVSGRGALVHVIDSLAPVSGRVAPASVSEADALAAALAALHPDLSAPALSRRSGNVASFAKTAAFYAPPTVERVAIAMKDGSMQAGFLVETWTQKTNLLHDTLVSGTGKVLSIELRTNTDSYNVFTENPNVAPQAVVSGPGAGNAESPIGWLAGSQLTTNITGNNAHAYLDTDANDKPDPGGSPATTDFLTAADLTVEPSTDSNKEVAVQNLFFFNNVIHDELYKHGFDEAAGNFQENNFGKGGRGGDPVDAEAQDGSGLDNANFATPHDGRNPRMQMYLWTGKGDHQVVIGSTIYLAQGAAFGPALDPAGITAGIILAHDGAGVSDTDGCETITTDLSNSIALIDRGNCTFVVKVKNAQVAGAVGVIIANQLGDSIFTMGGTDTSITIPSVMVGLASGDAIKPSLPTSGTIRLTEPPPLHRDGDVDSDIVFHEYGHGLTWRMIGRMRGAMSGAVGEGMSDVLAVIMNGDDAVGEYSFSDPLGLRSAPYTNYPRTYGDVTGSEVHFDGEVYGAIGWLLYQTYLGNGLTRSDVLDDIVDGMNFTPAGPAFEDMRDGILSSVLLNHPTRECLVWDAFAHYGVGVGATSAVHGSTIIVTESFTLPPQCQP